MAHNYILQLPDIVYIYKKKKKDQILLNNELHYFSCASSYYFVADESHLLMESIGWWCTYDSKTI